MMAPDLTLGSYSDVPARPPSEVEWEDLLYRLELMNRALTVGMEEIPEASVEAEGVLRALVEREEAVGRLLEVSAVGGVDAERDPAAAPRDFDGLSPALRFIRIRSRNFAMLQRRGLEVWDWRVFVAGTEIGIYQLLVGLARADIETLALLREIGGRERSC